VGYSDKWLWEESALGTGGENFVMDPHGSHTRAFITDVRPKLFDGDWKENVGGGDFLLYFGAEGRLNYKKELDAQLFANGPNLSNALYTSVSNDDAIKSEVRIRGGRTDDLVRVFLHVRNTVLKDVDFTRLAFFQFGSETYNYNSNFGKFVFGDSTGKTDEFDRTCYAGTNKSASNMYYSTNSGVSWYRQNISTTGPWWIALGPTPNKDGYSEPMVVGDRGLVIRSYRSSFGGVDYNTPSISVLCDKIELGPPAEVTTLKEGDYVDMELEFLVLPRPADMQKTLNNSPDSASLQYLNTLDTTWERVQAQAMRGISVTSESAGVEVLSSYPVEIRAPSGFDASSDVLMFKITGEALGFVPIVIDGLSSAEILSGQGLWASTDGSVYNFMTDETGAYQATYNRQSGKYELVFNIEVLEDTEYAFGGNPNPTRS